MISLPVKTYCHGVLKFWLSFVGDSREPFLGIMPNIRVHYVMLVKYYLFFLVEEGLRISDHVSKKQKQNHTHFFFSIPGECSGQSHTHRAYKLIQKNSITPSERRFQTETL